MARLTDGERARRNALHVRRYRDNLKGAVYALLGEKCVACNIADRRVLQIDHVHGGGKVDRDKHARGRSYPQYYQHILAHPDGYQILCANCNWIKRHENGETKRKHLP